MFWMNEGSLRRRRTNPASSGVNRRRTSRSVSMTMIRVGRSVMALSFHDARAVLRRARAGRSRLRLVLPRAQLDPVESSRLLARKPDAAQAAAGLERMGQKALAVGRELWRDGVRLPSYEAGQYSGLRRDDCLLTRKVKDGNEEHYVPDLDAEGKQKRGSVTHSYSISSAPFETAQGDYLEFYVVLERGRDGVLGRFTESLFRGVESHENDRLAYGERIVGDFTLARRAVGFEHVLMVGTGTGLAPFASMIKQLNRDASSGKRPEARFTLLHANRTFEELAYHRELLDYDSSISFDFYYVILLCR